MTDPQLARLVEKRRAAEEIYLELQKAADQAKKVVDDLTQGIAELESPFNEGDVLKCEVKSQYWSTTTGYEKKHKHGVLIAHHQGNRGLFRQINKNGKPGKRQFWASLGSAKCVGRCINDEVFWQEGQGLHTELDPIRSDCTGCVHDDREECGIGNDASFPCGCSDWTHIRRKKF